MYRLTSLFCLVEQTNSKFDHTLVLPEQTNISVFILDLSPVSSLTFFTWTSISVFLCRYIWPEWPAGGAAGGRQHRLHPAYSAYAPIQHHPGHPGRRNHRRPSGWFHVHRPRNHQRAWTVHHQGKHTIVKSWTFQVPLIYLSLLIFVVLEFCWCSTAPQITLEPFYCFFLLLSFGKDVLA